MKTEAETHWDRERRIYVDGKIHGFSYCAKELATVLASLAERKEPT
jgi:hypothetical protein